MTHSKKDLILQRLAESRQALFNLFGGLNEQQLTHSVHAEGSTWTILDLVRHLAQAEKGMTRQIDEIRQGGKGVPDNFDLNRYNAGAVSKQQHKSREQLMAEMSQNRAELLALVDSLQAEDWAKEGRHGSGNIMSIYEIVKIIGIHEKMHTKEIEEALNGSQK